MISAGLSTAGTRISVFPVVICPSKSSVPYATWTNNVQALPCSANHFVAVELLCQETQCRFNNSTTKTQHQMKCGLLLNIVVGKCSSIFKLLSSENKTLLIWWN